MSIIESRYFDAAPIRIEVDSFNPVTGAISVTVTMHSTTASLTAEDFFIVLIEEDVNTAPPNYDDTHVTRAVYDDTITLTGAGNTATFNTTFTIDPTWNTDNLRAVAFVQLADNSIIQTGSSDPMPDFKIRAMVPFSRTALGPSGGTFETDPVTFMNTGLTETFTVQLVIDEAPAGWTVAFRDSGGTVHTDPYAFGLTTDEQTTFTALITPSSPGFMRYHFEVTSTNLTRPLEVSFVYITDDVDALIVDDDGGESYEDYFTEAMDTAGKTYGIWNRSSDPLTAEVAQTFDVLIWNAGWAFPTLDADDKLFLADYLGDGRSLFLSGQDIGWELNDPGASPDPVWYHTYLHANYVRDDTNIMDLNGVAADPITDGLTLHIAGGTGANNQQYPDEIAPYDADATAILNYQGDGCGAIRSIDSVTGAKVVYLGFGFEGIDDAQDRHDLLTPALNWLRGPDVFADDFESGDTSAWTAASP